jgi:hypothetical protein
MCTDGCVHMYHPDGSALSFIHPAAAFYDKLDPDPAGKRRRTNS